MNVIIKPMVNVSMTPEDAQRFIQFQKHYEAFTMLLDAQVFDTRKGHVLIAFDAQGIIRQIDRNQNFYSG